MSGLVGHGPLFQLENHAAGLKGHQGAELFLCNLYPVGRPLGAEMELLLDVALTVEQQQYDGSLQHQEAFEASARAVVAVGPHVYAALMTRRLDVVGFRETVKTRFSDVMEMAVD